MVTKIKAVGDCNTLGANALEYKSYPERIGERLGVEVVNLGHTMATTREGVLKLRDLVGEADCVIIQFGLVDSYRTFRYSPYVLYYPDNPLRKQLRSLTKKFKKTCRRLGLNGLLGEVNVVDSGEYESNLRKMVEIAQPRLTLLLETIPNHQLERNSEIQRYNSILDAICADYDNCYKVDLYTHFKNNMDQFYQDLTHCNSAGCEYIAAMVAQKIAAVCPKEKEGE